MTIRPLIAAVVALLALPATAHGHAILEGTTPERGAELEASPGAVELRFSEPIEANFGAVRVYDGEGARVDEGSLFRPGGRGSEIAVALQPDLPDGTYTATYRVISADSHPVSSGFVFSVGNGAAGPASTVDELLADSEAGPVTGVASGVARGVDYAAIALAIGGTLFLAAVWLPALRSTAGAEPRWRGASEGFQARLRPIAAATICGGVVSGVAGIVLQASTAAGTSAWAALDPTVLGDVLQTRFGTVWGLRIVAWGVLGTLGYLLLARRGVGALRPAPLGATGLVVERVRPVALALLAVTLTFLATSPALAGHASTQGPVAVLFPANVAHVVAVSAWIGGLALLFGAVPGATSRLEGEKGRLLAAVLLRFSPLALVAVAVLLAGGVIQSLLLLEAPADLIDTAFGRAILVKATLLAALIALGAYQRRRSVPALTRVAERGESPARPGVLLRRVLRLELALAGIVLGVTAALVSYSPPDALSSGPYSTTADLGPAQLDMTVDPATPGSNEIHLYLLDPSDGSQYDRAKAADVSISLPDKDIGPLDVRAERAGPGHWVVPEAAFGLSGEWRVDVSARVSRFEAHEASAGVAIE